MVASSQCFGTGRLALTPVADWIRTPSVFSSLTTLDPGWRAEVERLVPSGRHGRSRGSSRAMVDAWRRIGFFEGLARALLVAAAPAPPGARQHPVVRPGDAGIPHVPAGPGPGCPLLIAATQRDDNQREVAALAAWAERMRATGVLAELPLGPLEAQNRAADGGVSAGRARRTDAELLQSTTGGFPLYVIEAMRGSGRAGRRPARRRPHGCAAKPARAGERSRPRGRGPGSRGWPGLRARPVHRSERPRRDRGRERGRRAVAPPDPAGRRRCVRLLARSAPGLRLWTGESATTLAAAPASGAGARASPSGRSGRVSAQIAAQYSRGGRPERAVTYYLRAAGIAAGIFAHTEAIRLHSGAGNRHAPTGPRRDRRELAVYEAMAAPLTARYGYSSPRLEQTLERCIVLAGTLRSRDSTVIGMVGLWVPACPGPPSRGTRWRRTHWR